MFKVTWPSGLLQKLSSERPGFDSRSRRKIYKSFKKLSHVDRVANDLSVSVK